MSEEMQGYKNDGVDNKKEEKSYGHTVKNKQGPFKFQSLREPDKKKSEMRHNMGKSGDKTEHQSGGDL
ncbi:hypothetical protein POVCU2_0022100 [Plasmodium ovale curtisi]|uniref:Uncharacterized protein n=1 Tax=Plasmodium ovale curtisi TaxID=864141 RepID=A0A1A8VSZ3_PLAOA|nr:hypothetical protein POVCU2_0022100 [Plasmodium ovale curtisi]SBS91172.1 hypothetical protein POVCU1_019990 [Plasmodium ovale curtisi]